MERLNYLVDRWETDTITPTELNSLIELSAAVIHDA